MYNGATRKLSLSRNIKCVTCGGNGSKSGAPATCSQCHGGGTETLLRPLGPVRHILDSLSFDAPHAILVLFIDSYGVGLVALREIDLRYWVTCTERYFCGRLQGMMQQIQQQCRKCRGSGRNVAPGDECNDCRSKGLKSEKHVRPLLLHSAFPLSHIFHLYFL
jgi:hypothetical protein